MREYVAVVAAMVAIVVMVVTGTKVRTKSSRAYSRYVWAIGIAGAQSHRWTWSPLNENGGLVLIGSLRNREWIL